MQYEEQEYSTADLKFLDLCEEIDQWKALAKHWKAEFEEERRLRVELMNNTHKDAMKGVGQALMFAMSVRDDENGNLVINKEDRKMLAEQYKD